MRRSKYTRPTRLTEQGEGGQKGASRLTTSAMIASLAAPGQRTRAAPFGQALAKRARGFGLAIHYHNRKRLHAEIERELEATYWESLDQMLARMDIVSVNCPHTPATYHLLSARRLKLMRPDAIIVNTARGEVIDENALARGMVGSHR